MMKRLFFCSKMGVMRITLINMFLAIVTMTHAQDFNRYFTDETLRIDYTFSGNAAHQEIAMDQLNRIPHWYGKRHRLSEVPVEGNGQITVRTKDGTAIYRNSFRLSKKDFQKGRLLLDLGDVGCVADVFINGQPIATLWKAPYRTDITEALRKGKNEIEIRVVNQWVNRIIGDQQPGCTQPVTYTPVKFYDATSPLLPAGLMGPVSIVY